MQTIYKSFIKEELATKFAFAKHADFLDYFIEESEAALGHLICDNNGYFEPGRAKMSMRLRECC